jgi:lipopolysaccharide biosynthesis glycosyltransferase
MIVVSAADECFAPHVATMLHSAWTHNPDAEFHLLDCGIHETKRAALAAWAERRGMALRIVQIDLGRFRGFLTTQYFSAASYARLLIPELLSGAERAIYIDADCVVVSNLAELWELPMGDAAVAGVADPLGAKWAAREYAFHGLYINAGVLLMNLPAWRRNCLTGATLDFIGERRPWLLDQDAINIVCSGDIIQLDEAWNVLVDGRPICQRSPATFPTPRIVHYSYIYKPWEYQDLAFADVYLHHRKQTPFPMERAPYRGFDRPRWRRWLNLVLGRRKYWYHVNMSRRSQRYVNAYLKRAGYDEMNSITTQMPSAPVPPAAPAAVSRFAAPEPPVP